MQIQFKTKHSNLILWAYSKHKYIYIIFIKYLMIHAIVNYYNLHYNILFILGIFIMFIY